jgi:hypothetical protein
MSQFLLKLLPELKVPVMCPQKTFLANFPLLLLLLWVVVVKLPMNEGTNK